MNAISTGTSDTSFSLAALNEPQARRVRVTCEYIDRLLSDIERIHATPSSHTLFTRYALDLPDPTRGKLAQTVAEIRAAMKRALSCVRAPDEDPIPESRAIHVILGAAGIAAEELKPRYMRGYGEVSDSIAAALTNVSTELCSLLAAADRSVESVAPHATPARTIANAKSAEGRE